MAVLQLGQHVAQHLEEGVIAHVVRHLHAVLPADGIPVDALVVQVAVVLVYQAPQGLEVADGAVVVFLLADAGAEEEEKEGEEERKLFHCQAILSG